jgi:hypothetical protein
MFHLALYTIKPSKLSKLDLLWLSCAIFLVISSTLFLVVAGIALVMQDANTLSASLLAASVSTCTIAFFFIKQLKKKTLVSRV